MVLPAELAPDGSPTEALSALVSNRTERTWESKFCNRSATNIFSTTNPGSSWIIAGMPETFKSLPVKATDEADVEGCWATAGSNETSLSLWSFRVFRISGKQSSLAFIWRWWAMNSANWELALGRNGSLLLSRKWTRAQLNQWSWRLWTISFIYF